MKKPISIEGNHPLTGTFIPSGNKNSAIPIICATLLTDGVSEISNFPVTKDVNSLLETLTEMGCSFMLSGETISITPSISKKINLLNHIPVSPQIGLLLATALLPTYKEIELKIDSTKERVSTHLTILESFGVQLLQKDNGTLSLKSPKKFKSDNILLSEASVTATEIAIFLSLFSEETIQLRNVACEPHIVDLINYLNMCGAKIDGAGTNVLLITGNRKLTGAKFRIKPDHIEIGSICIMAAMTKGEVKIKVDDADIKPILQRLEEFNISLTSTEGYIQCLPSSFKGKYAKPYEHYIKSSPWAGFPTDILPLVVVLATQIEGSCLIHEGMYSTRMYFVDELTYMGARIVQCDPHRVIAMGATKLFPTTIDTPDIRTGLALLGASLIANGESKIINAEPINKIFVNPLEKLRSLGAKIYGDDFS